MMWCEKAAGQGPVAWGHLLAVELRSRQNTAACLTSASADRFIIYSEIRRLCGRAGRKPTAPTGFNSAPRQTRRFDRSLSLFVCQREMKEWSHWSELRPSRLAVQSGLPNSWRPLANLSNPNFSLHFFLYDEQEVFTATTMFQCLFSMSEAPAGCFSKSVKVCIELWCGSMGVVASRCYIYFILFFLLGGVLLLKYRLTDIKEILKESKTCQEFFQWKSLRREVDGGKSFVFP